MNDTRETAYVNGATEETCKCRFHVGDEVLHAWKPEMLQSPYAINFDEEFGGWVLFCGLIGVHEQAYIMASERTLWEPHENGLWSWWTRASEPKEESHE